jgi:hypothetical protein
MKKLSLLSLFLLLSLSAFSQIKFGIRTGLASTINRVVDKDKNDGLAVSKYKNSFAFTFGPQLDFTISDNAAFITGLWFTTLNTSYNASVFAVSDYYVVSNSQFVSLPLGFKGYTNEFMTDGKIYFSCLGLADVKVSEKLKTTNIPNYDYTKYQSMFGASVQIASGLDLKLGESTAVYGGLFFNHDLFNRTSAKHINDDSNNAKYNDTFTLKHSQIGLELGVKF